MTQRETGGMGDYLIESEREEKKNASLKGKIIWK
jgi:hypothetical protein